MGMQPDKQMLVGNENGNGWMVEETQSVLGDCGCPPCSSPHVQDSVSLVHRHHSAYFVLDNSAPEGGGGNVLLLRLMAGFIRLMAGVIRLMAG